MAIFPGGFLTFWTFFLENDGGMRVSWRVFDDDPEVFERGSSATSKAIFEWSDSV